MKAVDERVRALEPSGLFHICVVDPSYQVTAADSCCEVAGPPIDLHIAEPMEREAGLPLLHCVTGHHIDVSGLGGPERPRRISPSWRTSAVAIVIVLPRSPRARMRMRPTRF